MRSSKDKSQGQTRRVTKEMETTAEQKGEELGFDNFTDNFTVDKVLKMPCMVGKAIVYKLQAETPCSKATITVDGRVKCAGCDAFEGSLTGWEKHLGSGLYNAAKYTYVVEDHLTSQINLISLQDLIRLCWHTDLNLLKCVYCRKYAREDDCLIICSSCPAAFHKTCYESNVDDKLPTSTFSSMEDVDDDDQSWQCYWQCYSCRHGASCPCNYCKEHKPHEQPGLINLPKEAQELWKSVRPGEIGPPPTAAAPGHSPASGNNAAADGLQLSKLAPGDYCLAKFSILANADMALQDLLLKAESPDDLLELLDDAMARLKRLQLFKGNGVPEAMREFEAGYQRLQTWGQKRAQAEGPGKEEVRTKWTGRFKATLMQLIEDAAGPTDSNSPASGNNAAADGLHLSKLAPGDYCLAKFSSLASADKVLQDLLLKAGSPDDLLELLDDGMARLKPLQGNGAEAVKEFEAGYQRLQTWGQKRAQAEGPGKEAECTKWTGRFKATLMQLIEDAARPTDP